MFTPFHKPPYTYPYGRSVDETTTATIYPKISECQRALDVLTLQPTPYDPNYVKGLYSKYTYSDDDFYPETKGKVEESDRSSSANSTLMGSGYIIDSDTDMLINTSSYFGDDDIYPLARGEIKDNSPSPIGKHCMMALRGKESGNRVHGGHDRRNASGQIINQAQIRHARWAYTGELPLGINPGEDELAALHFIISEQKAQLDSKKRVLERRRAEADASSQRRANLSSY
jgi:hypothetical protein